MMFKNMNWCSKTGNYFLKVNIFGPIIALFGRFCSKICAKVRSHIARLKTSRTHAHRTHSCKPLSARTSARTSHVRKCDNTHMCAATQHLCTFLKNSLFICLFWQKGWNVEGTSSSFFLGSPLPCEASEASCIQKKTVLVCLFVKVINLLNNLMDIVDLLDQGPCRLM